MSCRKASITFKLPKTTLERYVKKIKDSHDKTVNIAKIGGFKNVFTEEQENELSEYILSIEQRLNAHRNKITNFSISRKESLKSSFQQRNSIGWCRLATWIFAATFKHFPQKT